MPSPLGKQYRHYATINNSIPLDEQQSTTISVAPIDVKSTNKDVATLCNNIFDCMNGGIAIKTQQYINLIIINEWKGKIVLFLVADVNMKANNI